MTMKLCVAAIWVVFLLSMLGLGGAEEASPSWHQWGGPDRNFHSESTGLATSWPASGPEAIWSRPLGEGYSTVVVDDGTLFTMYRDEPDELIVALAASTGETLWEHRYPAPLVEDMNYGTWLRQAGPGPFATPLLLAGRLYAVGVSGKFHALDKNTGRVVWSHDLDEEFGMSGYRGYASSPISYGNNVILPVGGRGQAVVAFDQDSGAVAWKNQDFDLAPASPVLIKVDGEDQLVVFGPQEVVGLDPRSGDFLWSHPHETNYGLNISTPVWGAGNLLFCSSAYNGGSRVIRLNRADGKTTLQQCHPHWRSDLRYQRGLRAGIFCRVRCQHRERTLAGTELRSFPDGPCRR
jgi:outer membrane protein assembly factor BamB